MSLITKSRVSFAHVAILLAVGTSRLWGLPFITSFSPTFGSYADSTIVIITGGNFTGGTLTVKYGGASGVVDTTAGLVDPSHIQSQVPVTAPVGPGRIYVQVGSNPANSTLSTTDFYVLGPGPYISDFSGPVNGLVTINGAHFNNPITVRFDTGTTNGNLVASPTSFQVGIPASATTGFISVTTTSGSYTNTSQIFYVPPAISGFTPTAGRTGTNVMISGQNFIGVSSVTFDGVAAAFTTPTSNTNLQATVPVNAMTGPILVTAPAGSAQTSSNFVVQPTISGFSPGFGAVGTNVTVTGANLNASGFSVKFGGVNAPNHSTPTFSSFTVTVPNGATNAPITVTTVDGSATSSQLFYLPPRITGFTPTNTGFGSSVTITGSNFLGASALTFNGTPASAFSVTNNTLMGAVVPGGVITGPLTVTTPAGTVNSGTLLFYGTPTISSFTPTHGLPGTNVAITGVNFLGTTGVLFGGISAGFVVTNNTTIGAVVPPNAPSGPITVIAPAGTTLSADNFIIDSADIAVSLADAPDPVFVGSNLVYTLIVANNGPFPAYQVKLTNTLPASVNLLLATTTQGSLNTNLNPILGTLGPISSGGSATVTLTVAPRVPGTITDTASVGSDIPEANPANNSGSVSTTVWPLPLLSIAPLTNQVQVSWPGVLSNFTLQFKGALNAPYDWSNMPVAPVLLGGSNIVIDGTTNVSRFYRLKD